VIAIIPTADRGKATVKVRIGLDQKDPRVLPDMGARVSFMQAVKAGAETAEVPKGVLLPASAIVQRDGKSVVFVVDENRVNARPVVPGQSRGDLRLVEGVPPAARIVRVPPAEMNEGTKVSIASARQ
jgi:hypothetical protein